MGFAVINLKHTDVDNRGRLIVTNKYGKSFAFSSYDINKNQFVIGKSRYSYEKLKEDFEYYVIKEIVEYVRTSLCVFEDLCNAYEW